MISDPPVAIPSYRNLLVLAAALLVARVGYAQTWQLGYDASLGTLPSAQGFVLFSDDPPPDDGLDESNYAVSGGVLSQGPTGGGSDDVANRQWYELGSAALDFDRDVLVVDLSLLIIESTLSPPPGGAPRAGFGVQLSDRLGRVVVLYVGSAGVFLYGSDGSTSALAFLDTTDTFHDYHLRVTPTGATVAVDGVELATLERASFGSGATPDRLLIGDLTLLQRSSSELERFSVARFPVPSPEVRNYQVVTQTTASDSSSPKALTVSCPAGSVALTGGASTAAGPDVGISESGPGSGTPPTSWIGSARELVDTGAAWDLRVDVVCGEVSGYERVEIVGVQSTNAVQTETQVYCPTTKRPFAGGVSLSGASLRQTLQYSYYDSTLIDPYRWAGGALDFGAAPSTSPWGLDVSALCSDTTRQETHYEDTGFVGGSPKSLVVNCLGGKLPIGGGAAGGDGGLEWSRPKDGTPSQPPVGWDAQARGSSTWGFAVSLDCAPLADPTVSANGLLARFRAEFDAYDSWGWAHGTLVNGVGFDPGIDGQAFSFDGVSDQWVSVPSQTFDEFDAIDMYPQADFTVGAWIKTSTSPVTPSRIVELYDPGGTPTANWSTWFLGLTTDGHPQGYLRAAAVNAATQVEEPTPLNDGQWHHVAMSRDRLDSRLYLYVDGLRVAETALSVGVTDQPLTPGNPGFGDPVSIGVHRLTQSTDVSSAFTGQIDDFTYWDRALTQEEIANVAGCGVPVLPRTLNLDADRFSSPPGAGHTLCVFLPAGTHELVLVDPASDPDARFTGWSPGAALPWGTAFSVDPEIESGFVFGLPVGAASGQDAFDATLDKDTLLTLSTGQRVHFYLEDTTAFDNRGGVSIRVPEPGLPTGALAGAVLLVVLARRRPDRSRSR